MAACVRGCGLFLCPSRGGGAAVRGSRWAGLLLMASRRVRLVVRIWPQKYREDALRTSTVASKRFVSLCPSIWFTVAVLLVLRTGTSLRPLRQRQLRCQRHLEQQMMVRSASNH